MKSEETGRGIRVHDLCSLVCNRWLTDDLLDFMFQTMNVLTTPHYFQVMSEPLMFSQSFRLRFLDVLEGRHKNGSLKYIHFALNVRKCSKSGVVTVSSSGNHWTYFSFSVSLDEFYYGDSLGWAMPKNLFSLLKPIFQLFQSHSKGQSALARPKMMHAPESLDRNGQHKCCYLCYQAFPRQTCGSICGLNPLLMCSLAATKPLLWKTVVNERQPLLSIRRGVSRLSSLTQFSSLLRVEAMSWLVNCEVDLSPLILDLDSIPQSHKVVTASGNFQGMSCSLHIPVPYYMKFTRHIPRN